jgi:excinuclease ABC subunit A
MFLERKTKHKQPAIIDPDQIQTRQEEIRLVGATHHNLKSIDVNFPLNTLTCITGMSGSGKSTLLYETLYAQLTKKIGIKIDFSPGHVDQVMIPDKVRRVTLIDQSPIGKTPRSNPATYTKLFDFVRHVFAATQDARIRGYAAGRFSFNVKGGRCEACQGDGQIKIEMQFLPDIYVTCDVCKGKRYNRETLEVMYRDKSIADVLEMSVDEAAAFFEHHSSISQKLKTLQAVGLGYVKLGQSAPTLSGGEAQRVKLAKELSTRSHDHVVYLLDEPTTGLHFADVQKLLDVLVKLVEQNNTVVVIEHNLDIIKNADWVIDLGPEGGERGGEVVVTGTPEMVASHPASFTGIYLKTELAQGA